MANRRTESFGFRSKRKLPTHGSYIVFQKQYVYGVDSPESVGTDAMCLLNECNNCFPDDQHNPNSFFSRTYGNWSNEAPSKSEDFMPQNNGPFDSHDYIELNFLKEIYPIRISIFEKNAPGTIIKVWAWNRRAQVWQKLWSGPPQAYRNGSRVFTPPLAICKFRTKIIRLELNYSLADYYTQIDGALLFGTDDLILPKDGIKNHSLINVIPKWYDPECTIPERANDIHNLTRHVSSFKSFVSDLENVKFIIRRNYVIWESDDKDHPKNPSLLRVKIMDYRKRRSLNVLPDEMLLKIFGYLDLKTLIRCSQLNKRFNALAQDKKFYRSLNLKPYWNYVDDRTLHFLEKRCHRLKRMDLSWCGGPRLYPQTFINFLEKCGEELTHLRLNTCGIATKKVIKAITENCPHLKELCLRWCYFIDKVKIENLEKLKFLECLNLHSSYISSEQLCTIIRNNRGLRHLNVGGGCQNLEGVTAMIAEFCPHIESLNFYDHTNISSEELNHLSRCTNLRELDIGRRRIATESVDSLGNIFKNCRSLEKVFVSHLSLRDEIVEPLLECKKVKQLDVSFSEISSELVSRMFTAWPELRLLDLSDCQKITESNVQEWQRLYQRVSIKFNSGLIQTISH